MHAALVRQSGPRASLSSADVRRLTPSRQEALTAVGAFSVNFPGLSVVNGLCPNLPQRPFRLGGRPHVTFSRSLGTSGEWSGDNAPRRSVAQQPSISREPEEDFALRRHVRADAASLSESYDDAAVPLPAVGDMRNGGIRPNITIDQLASPATSFRSADEGGTITSGSSSQLSYRASATLIGSPDAVDRLGLDPMARDAGRVVDAVEPQHCGFAPVGGAHMALRQAGTKWSRVEPVELNEAFAVQSRVRIDAWDVSAHILNFPGGVIALGHPPDAAEAGDVAAMVHRPIVSGQRCGVAVVCVGPGQELVVVIEHMSSTARRN